MRKRPCCLFTLVSITILLMFTVSSSLAQPIVSKHLWLWHWKHIHLEIKRSGLLSTECMIPRPAILWHCQSTVCFTPALNSRGKASAFFQFQHRVSIHIGAEGVLAAANTAWISCLSLCDQEPVSVRRPRLGWKTKCSQFVFFLFFSSWQIDYFEQACIQYATKSTTQGMTKFKEQYCQHSGRMLPLLL